MSLKRQRLTSSKRHTNKIKNKLSYKKDKSIFILLYVND
jgi:hypothetical protein